nr:ATP-dependent Clp protease ATP-binding subunit CLPT2, chloroplastic-like [Ipomoea batatas]
MSKYLSFSRSDSSTILSMPTTSSNSFCSFSIAWGWRISSVIIHSIDVAVVSMEAEIMSFKMTIFSSSAHFLGDSGDRNPSPSSLSPEHPPLTEDAQKALDWALNEKVKEVVYFNSANVYGSCFSNAIGFWFVHRLLVFSDEIGSSWNQGNTATKKKLRICQESML